MVVAFLNFEHVFSPSQDNRKLLLLFLVLPRVQGPAHEKIDVSEAASSKASKVRIIYLRRNALLRGLHRESL